MFSIEDAFYEKNKETLDILNLLASKLNLIWTACEEEMMEIETIYNSSLHHIDLNNKAEKIALNIRRTNSILAEIKCFFECYSAKNEYIRSINELVSELQYTYDSLNKISNNKDSAIIAREIYNLKNEVDKQIVLLNTNVNSYAALKNR